MRLQRLELFGFKSFGDRTVLNFERALTGIVGPNGCGKSNVVDAIRWVLGEQRPTSMRGAEMTDVIFKGSTSRDALGVAEVTVVLDNSNGVLETQGPEVSITRRVYKSGEGEYLIDGDRVRLKDVRDMLYDTGLGSRGYAVLEQGRIDAVLSANPIDRRAIFEEAAGISRYRQRRHETENKLKRVERDLERLADVTRELGTRSRSLKIQAGKAERFLVARDAWREEAQRYARHRAFDLDRRLVEVREEIEAADKRVRELRELRESSDGTIHERELERTALDGQIELLNARASELAAELSTLDERKVQLSARVAGWRRAALEEGERAEGLSERLVQRRDELETVSARVRELTAECETARAHLAERRRAQAELRQSLHQAGEAFEEQNERVLGLLHEKTAAENEVVRHERNIEPLSERARRASERSADAAVACESAKETAEEARGELDRAEAFVVDLDRRREHLDGEARALEVRSRELFERKSASEMERAALESKIETLLDRAAEREHLDVGARALLPGGDAGEDGPGVQMLGLLADHLRTETRYARALDGALGERAQALVVSGGEDLERVIEWLRTGQRGRARLVAPTGIGAGNRRSPELPAHLPGVLGPLLAVTDVDAGYEELARLLLGGVVVTTDLAAALGLVARSPELTAVTMDGDCVDAAGVTGGYREVAHGPVGRRASALDLSREVEGLARRAGAIGSELAQLQTRRDVLEADAREALAALDDARDALGDARGAAESARIRAEDAKETAELASVEKDELERERMETEELLREARERQRQFVEEFQQENAHLEGLLQSRRSLEERREELAREESHARVEDTRLAEQRDAAGRREADTVRACAELDEERTRTLELAERHTRDADGGETAYEEIDGQRESLLTDRAEAAERLEDVRGHEREVREAIVQLRARTDAVTRELEAEMNALSEVQLEEQRVSLAKDELQRRAEEELSLQEHELQTEFEPEEELLQEAALAELEQRVADLREELDKLGSVNLEAVEELEGVSARLTFLEEQQGDVVRARTALQNTLKTINEESERLFLEAFAEIRENFERLFRQLFGGGRATIELEEGAPVLEAGIEISARPPGREMLPLGLLSGGQRTMTALGLLFAVFQSRPSPFCVLDEVDAALDDANIARFLVLLDGFLASTQFVVVTHNKGTMSACQSLYGITMETRGVSRQVSVELDDVDEFVPEAEGDAQRAQDARRELFDEAPLEPLHANGNGHELVMTEDEEPVVELVPHAAPAEEAEAEEAPVEAEREELVGGG